MITHILEVSLFGEFEMLVDGQPVHLSATQQWVVAALVLRSSLMEELHQEPLVAWQCKATDNTTTLRDALSVIRVSVGQDGQAYFPHARRDSPVRRFVPAPDGHEAASIDVLQFDTLIPDGGALRGPVWSDAKISALANADRGLLMHCTRRPATMSLLLWRALLWQRWRRRLLHQAARYGVAALDPTWRTFERELQSGAEGSKPTEAEIEFRKGLDGALESEGRPIEPWTPRQWAVAGEVQPYRGRKPLRAQDEHADGAVVAAWEEGADWPALGGSYAADRATAQWSLAASGHEGFPFCGRLAYDWHRGVWCGGYLNFPSKDVGGSKALHFWVRGDAGDERIRVGLKGSDRSPNAEAVFALASIGVYTRAGRITRHWQEVCVPLDQFVVADLTSLWSIVFSVMDMGGRGLVAVGPISFR